MGILLGFMPFIVFAALSGLSIDLALWTALAFAFVIGIRDFAHTRLLRILDVGCLTLFALLALYTGFIQPGISIGTVRLLVDGGLLVIALVSIFVGNPFTLEYTREQTPKEHWTAPHFLRANYIAAGVWVFAFAAMTAADAAATFDARLSLRLDVAVNLAILALALVFTARYPAYVRAQASRLKYPPAPERR